MASVKAVGNPPVYVVTGEILWAGRSHGVSSEKVERAFRREKQALDYSKKLNENNRNVRKAVAETNALRKQRAGEIRNERRQRDAKRPKQLSWL